MIIVLRDNVIICDERDGVISNEKITRRVIILIMFSIECVSSSN